MLFLLIVFNLLIILQANSVLKSGKVSELLDPSLDSRDSDQEKTERMVLAATLCIRRAPRLRPCISVVSFLPRQTFISPTCYHCYFLTRIIAFCWVCRF